MIIGASAWDKPPHSPYFDHIEGLINWVNFFRTRPDALARYTEEQYWTRARWVNTTDAYGETKTQEYACFDHFHELEMRDDDECTDLGMFKHGTKTLQRLQDQAETEFKNNSVTMGMETNSYLMQQASKYLSDQANCTLWQPGHHQEETNYFRTDYHGYEAYYEDMQFHVVYPQRFSWSDEKETVWDWIVGDDDTYHELRHNIMSGWYDQIGVACDCHFTFTEWCVVFVGRQINEYRGEFLEDHRERQSEEMPLTPIDWRDPDDPLIRQGLEKWDHTGYNFDY